MRTTNRKAWFALDRPKERRVPKEHLKIARHFNAGADRKTDRVPKGRLNEAPSPVPDGTLDFARHSPALKTPGYFRQVPSGLLRIDISKVFHNDMCPLFFTEGWSILYRQRTASHRTKQRRFAYRCSCLSVLSRGSHCCRRRQTHRPSSAPMTNHCTKKNTSGIINAASV
jgi:hypothetical protein